MATEEAPKVGNGARSKWPRRLGIAGIILVVVILLGAWWIKSNLYASPFHPTKLDEKEQQVLDEKLDRLERGIQEDAPSSRESTTTSNGARLEPEPYREDPARRRITISERELNSLIAKDEETARRVAVDLSDGMISVKLLIPVDEEFPLLGGKTLRLNCGITLDYEAGKPVVALRGVSIGGVPIPNAWLGNIKHIDLVQEFGGRGGFWDTFSEGVEDLKVSDGSLFVKLKE